MNEARELWRAKRIDNGEWVHGVPLQHCDGDWQLISGKVGAMAIQTIVADTLGECTGLRDKSGKLIFEGDIVTHDKLIFVVEWDSDRATFVIRYFNIVSVFTMLCGWELEVIGNIHDNPKLLKGADNENK